MAISEAAATAIQKMFEYNIPENRKALLKNHEDLEQLSLYCEETYMTEPNKQAALEKTKNYAVQALASVAYQINALASDFLDLLEHQEVQLKDMENQINHIGMTVDIHKEKVARREIGLLTTSKPSSRTVKVLQPTNPERVLKYTRKNIDYSILDHIGHGIQSKSDFQHQNSNNSNRRPSMSGSIAGRSQRTSVSSGTASDNSSTIARAKQAPGPVAPPSDYKPGSLALTSKHAQMSNNIYTNPTSQPLQNNTAYNYQEKTRPPSLLMPPPPPPVDFNPMTPAAYDLPLPSPPMEDALPSPPADVDAGFISSLSYQQMLGMGYIDVVKAIYEYVPDDINTDELQFNEGDIIYVTKKNNDNWWEGGFNEKQGLFPGNYVESILHMMAP